MITFDHKCMSCHIGQVLITRINFNNILIKMTMQQCEDKHSRPRVYSIVMIKRLSFQCFVVHGLCHIFMGVFHIPSHSHQHHILVTSLKHLGKFILPKCLLVKVYPSWERSYNKNWGMSRRFMDRQKRKSFSEVNKWIRKEGKSFQAGRNVQRNNGVIRMLGYGW